MTRVKTVGTAMTAFLVVLAMLLVMLPARAFASDLESTVTFTFSNDGITASGDESGYKIEGTALTINESGTYTITGSCTEGSIKVKKETTGVTLILEDLTLGCSTTAPLSCNKGTETTLYITGTVTLSDNEDISNEDSDDFEGAAIKVKSENASLTITGDGTLNVNGSCKNGIKGAATATVTITDGVTLNVNAENNGIACDNLVNITGGVIRVTAGNEAIKASPDEDDTESKGDVTVSGGTLTLVSGDDAVHGDRNVTITGGTLTIQAGDDAIHADYDLVLGSASSGPDVTIAKSYEGLEGATITLLGGTGSITASDDGVNAATDAAVSEIAIRINGGKWIIDASGDGLDAGGDSRNNSGGNIIVNGGVTEVYGAANDGNAALDFDGTMTYNGGTLLAVGMGSMAQVPGSGTYVAFGQTGMGMGGGPGGMGGQPGSPGRMRSTESGLSDSSDNSTYEAQTGGVSLTAGSAITIRDASGNTIYSAKARRNANSVVFCSDKITSGNTYTLNGTVTATASSGQGGTAGGPGNQPGGMTPPENGTEPPEKPEDPRQEAIPGGSEEQNPPPETQPAPSETSGTTESIESTGFSDVPAKAWYASAVAFVREHGMMNGVGNGQFSPNTELTRAQAAQILYNIAGNGETVSGGSFTDVPAGSWYADAVNWAASKGLVEGSGNRFYPNENITREQLAAILYRFAKTLDFTYAPSADLSRYDDAASVSRYAAEAMAWAVGNGVIEGATTTTLSPQGTATRAQMAQMLQNFYMQFA